MSHIAREWPDQEGPITMRTRPLSQPIHQIGTQVSAADVSGHVHFADNLEELQAKIAEANRAYA
jgi:hypothetical protein